MRYIKAASAIVFAVTLAYGCEVCAENTEQVTDIFEIYAMLREYTSYNLFEDVRDVYIREYNGEQRVFVEVYGVFSDSEKSIRQYIARQRIDEDKVEFMWLYRHSDEDTSVAGDANFDGLVTIRDCAYIASCLARGKTNMLPDCADYNGDGRINIRDAAAISQYLAVK